MPGGITSSLIHAGRPGKRRCVVGAASVSQRLSEAVVVVAAAVVIVVVVE